MDDVFSLGLFFLAMMIFGCDLLNTKFAYRTSEYDIPLLRKLNGKHVLGRPSIGTHEPDISLKHLSLRKDLPNACLDEGRLYTEWSLYCGFKPCNDVSR